MRPGNEAPNKLRALAQDVPLAEQFARHGSCYVPVGVESMSLNQTVAKILIVEDDKVARDGMAQLLKLEGYEIRSASGGEHAIGIAADWTPDVIVSDVNMPRGGGFELVSALRNLDACADSAIILISARDDINRRVSGLDLGADDFLKKPIDADELLARIRSHLRTSVRCKLLKKNAVLDECSGLLNRRGMIDALEREAERAARGSIFSILVIDLDDFKQVNDEHGHGVGDQVLRLVARSLEGVCRRVDQPGRWGCDEFIVLLSDCSAEDAAITLRRFRKGIEQDFEISAGGSISIACSIGAATYLVGTPLDDLIVAADRAMYRDKEQRRRTSLAN